MKEEEDEEERTPYAHADIRFCQLAHTRLLSLHTAEMVCHRCHGLFSGGAIGTPVLKEQFHLSLGETCKTASIARGCEERGG